MINIETIKVSSKSNPSGVAFAISKLIKDSNKLTIQVVGAGSLNQAIKAIAIARGYLAPIGNDLVVIPSFNNININNKERTAIKLLIELI